jgi:phosphinothricin acetyltransferase
MDIEIRDAAAAHVAAITAIYNDGIAERSATFETEPRTEAHIAARLTLTDRYPLLVAVETTSGNVLGWAGLSEYRPRACYAGIGEFSIYLARHARGRGIGKALLLALIDAARARGYWKVLSRVFPSNAASRALCRSCGFREVGVYEKHAALDGQWLDTIIVERLIEQPVPPNAGA